MNENSLILLALSVTILGAQGTPAAAATPTDDAIAHSPEMVAAGDADVALSFHLEQRVVASHGDLNRDDGLVSAASETSSVSPAQQHSSRDPGGDRTPLPIPPEGDDPPIGYSGEPDTPPSIVSTLPPPPSGAVSSLPVEIDRLLTEGAGSRVALTESQPAGIHTATSDRTPTYREHRGLDNQARHPRTPFHQHDAAELQTRSNPETPLEKAQIDFVLSLDLARSVSFEEH